MLPFGMLLSILISSVNAGEACNGSSSLVPVVFDIAKAAAKKYDFVEAGLQIFRNRQIDCDGWLTQWKFLAQGNSLKKIHLAVFRERAPVGSNVFDVVGETYVKFRQFRSPGPGKFSSFKPRRSIKVSKNDYLGFYYDRFDVNFQRLSIKTAREERANFFETHVVLLDAARGVIKGGTIDTSALGQKVYRDPALTARISPFPSARGGQRRMRVSSTTAKSFTLQNFNFQAPVETERTEQLLLIDSRCFLPLDLEPDVCYRYAPFIAYDETAGICGQYYGCAVGYFGQIGFSSFSECHNACYYDARSTQGSKIPTIPTTSLTTTTTTTMTTTTTQSRFKPAKNKPNWQMSKPIQLPFYLFSSFPFWGG